MKLIRTVLVLSVALLAATWIVEARFTYPIVLADDAISARWSKDGRAVFYSTRDKVYRYDLTWHWRTVYNLPDGLILHRDPDKPNSAAPRYVIDLDVSPDGRKVALMLVEGDDGPSERWLVYVLDLSGGKTRHVVTMKQSRKNGLAWLNTNWIAYDDESPGTGGVWQMRPDGSDRRLLPRHAGISYLACDGSGFAYGEGGTWQVYQAATRQFASVKIPRSENTDDSGYSPRLIFLSEQRLGIRLYDRYSNRSHRVIEIGTNREKPFTLLGARGEDINISPDGKHVFYTEVDFHRPSRLYLDTVPEASAKALCGQ